MLDLSRGSHSIIVRRNQGHPEAYMWLNIDGRTYFFGVILLRMTRRDVRDMAERWLREHPDHLEPILETGHI